MGLMSKLKEILFDEETVEIPVITKETKKEKDSNKKVPSTAHEKRADSRVSRDEDEVIIRKIETPKRETKVKEDTLFDMPKFASEETPIEESPKREKINTFTFPVFDDEEKKEPEHRTEKKIQPESSKKDPEPKEISQKQSTNRISGYSNAYDYSYGKYKGDYMTSRESNHEIVTKTLEEKEEKKAFTPSPIISPVYGVLNENYKKEDIISKSEKNVSKGTPLDLDSVRRKAYGTLEDEIEASLVDKTPNKVEEVTEDFEETYDAPLDEEGISIDDLLTGNAEEDEKNVDGNIEVIEEPDDTELFDVLDDKEEELDIDEAIFEETKKLKPVELRKPELDDARPPLIPDDAEELNMEKTENNNDGAIGEEDLFDLIDSLYEGKGDD